MSIQNRQDLNDLEEIKGDLESSNNQRQMNARERISRNSEFERQKEHLDQGMEWKIDDGVPDDDLDGGVSDSFAVTDDTLKVALKQQPTQKLEPEKPRQYTIKVNGQDVTMTEEEMLARASKVEAADRYLAERKREADLLLAEAKLRVEQQLSVPDAAPAEVSDEDLELVRALQVGDEHTAAKALKARIATIRPTQPAIEVDAIAARVKDQMDFQNAQRWFLDEYKDIASDPKLMMIAQSLDAQYRTVDLAEKKATPYLERYRTIGEDVRKWKGGNPEFAEKVKQKRETLKSIPQASMRNTDLGKDDDDNLTEEEYHQKAIQETARRRYQNHLGG